METNFEQFKLKPHDDFTQRYVQIVGEHAYYKKRAEAYELFRKLRPGKIINLRTMIKQENVELFIKLACQYIESSRRKGFDDYCFSDDYSLFYRLPPLNPPLVKKEKCNNVTM